MAMSIYCMLFNNLFLASSIVLSTVLIAPQSCFAVPSEYDTSGRSGGSGITDAVFMIKLEGKVQKLLQGKGKPFNDLISYLVDIKIMIEDYYNISINNDVMFKQMRHELGKSNVPHNHKQMDILSKKIQKREKECRKKGWFSSIFFNVPYHDLSDHELHEFNMLYQDYRRNEKCEKVEEEEIELPASFVFGVTATLCGLFLYVVPIPGCRKMGEAAITLGMGYCIQSVCTKMDENEKEERERRKQQQGN